MVGPSGSGKSYYARNLLKKLTDDHYVVLLSSDDFRAVISNIYDQTINRLVFDWIEKSCGYFLSQHHDVIIDATSLTISERKNYIKIGKKYNSNITAILSTTSKEICLLRNKNRDRVVPDSVIERQFSRLVLPTHSEGFDHIITI
jgi:predicted kinase